jgi:hypothetical protein
MSDAPLPSLAPLLQAGRAFDDGPPRPAQWSEIRPSSSHDGFIDLTDDAAPQPRRTHRVSSPFAGSSSEPAPKRRRTSVETHSSHGGFAHTGQGVLHGLLARRHEQVAEEVLDLTGTEDDAGQRRHQEAQHIQHEELQRQQDRLLKESVVAQQGHRKASQKLATSFECTICLSPMEDITATLCGQFFFTLHHGALAIGANSPSRSLLLP